MNRVWRWLPWLALGVVAVTVLVVGTHRTSHSTPQSEATHIASLVRCPVCQGETVAQSSAPASVEIRNQIDQELSEGQNQAQILSQLVAAYGSGILEKPEAQGVGLVVWVVPVVAVVAAIAGLALAFARWRPRRGVPASGADRALVEQALHRDEEGAGASDA